MRFSPTGEAGLSSKVTTENQARSPTKGIFFKGFPDTLMIKQNLQISLGLLKIGSDEKIKIFWFRMLDIPLVIEYCSRESFYIFIISVLLKLLSTTHLTDTHQNDSDKTLLWVSLIFNGGFSKNLRYHIAVSPKQSMIKVHNL